jgi:murein L,D-transpeptidase YafK
MITIPKSSGRLILFVLICAVVGETVAVLWLFPRRQAAFEKLSSNTTIDRIVVEKSRRRLSVFRDGKEIKTYRIALGGHPVGPKVREGDLKTPEGLYSIDFRNRQSDYHLALHISYPRPEDVRRAQALGVPAGGDIMIHGLPNGRGWIGKLQRQSDWTTGCIALTDPEIEELWRITPDGTPIEIRP